MLTLPYLANQLISHWWRLRFLLHFVNPRPGHVVVAGPWLGAKSTSKIPDPSKIFVLSYKNILIKEIFHFEASYYGSQHPPLRTSCDTYCSTGVTGNKHKLFGKWSFSAPRAQNWASKVSKTIYLTPGTCLEVLLTSWTPSGCSGRL